MLSYRTLARELFNLTRFSKFIKILTTYSISDKLGTLRTAWNRLWIKWYERIAKDLVSSPNYSSRLIKDSGGQYFSLSYISSKAGVSFGKVSHESLLLVNR